MQNSLMRASAATVLAVTPDACSGMSTREKNITNGAVISGNVGVAAVSGITGNQVDPKKK